MTLQFTTISSVLALCIILILAGCATGGGQRSAAKPAAPETPVSSTLAAVISLDSHIESLILLRQIMFLGANHL